MGLFPGNQELLRREETAEFERLLAAWFYISNRYKLEEILENDRLRDACSSISQALFERHTARLTPEVEVPLKKVSEAIKSKQGDLRLTPAEKVTFEGRLDKVRALKREATALRNQREFPRALSTLAEAIRQLEVLSIERSLTEDQARDIRGELADAFGMKGGIHRRENALDAALEAYRKGRDIEHTDKQSTYNLSNVITLSITFEGRSPTDPEIHHDLQTAIERLQADTDGPRKDEWWAWSDLAQFYLLLNELDQARDCYAKGLNKTGATPDEIKRHVTVLEELADKIADTAPEISNNIRVLINELKH